MLSKFFKKEVKGLHLSDIKPSEAPILNFDELIGITRQHGRLRSIRQLTGTSDDTYQLCYQPFLTSYVELIQLIPASEAHHHSSLGGLLVHTLEVIEYALKVRRKFALPRFSTAEIVSRQQQVWTYAVFVTAVMHDVGKAFSNYRIIVDDKHWNIFGCPLIDLRQQMKTYSIQRLKTSYRRHEEMAPVFFHLLPTAGRQWLGRYPDVFHKLSIYVSGHKHDDNELSMILKQSEGATIAENLMTTSAETRLAGSKVPLAEDIMNALRAQIRSKVFRFNENGAIGWKKEGFIYLVSKRVLDTIRQYLEDKDISVPGDNIRLMNELQDFNFIIPTAEGRAIWKGVNIIGNDYETPFTMLKFKTSQLLENSDDIAEFSGRIEVAGIRKAESAEKPKNNEPSNVNGKEVVASAEKIPENVDTSKKIEIDSSVEENAQQEKPLAAVDINQDRKQLGVHFYTWLTKSLHDKNIMVNEERSTVHSVEEGVVLMTPVIFIRYLIENGYAENDASKKDNFSLVQKGFQKINKNLQIIKNKHVYKFTFSGEKRTSTVYGYLVPYENIFSGESLLKARKHVNANLSLPSDLRKKYLTSSY